MIKLRLFVVGPRDVWVVDVVIRRRVAQVRPGRPAGFDNRLRKASAWATRGAVESPEVADMGWSRARLN